MTRCAMAHLDFCRRGTRTYAQLFQPQRALQLPREHLLEAFRRMEFAVLSRNCDDHPKNTSFVLRQGRGIVGEVAAAVGRWPEFAAAAGVDAEEAARIGALHLRP